MNITNYELLQFSIEIIGALFCIIVAIYLRINRMTKKVKYLLVMFNSCALLFFSDALAYIFQNNTDKLSVFLNPLCVTVLFLTNCVVMVTFASFCVNEMETAGIRIPKFFLVSVCAISFFNVFFVFINTFTKWIFWFDDNNSYRREYGWYIYTASMGVGVLICMIFTAIYIRRIPKTSWIGMLAYEVVPFISIVVQFFFPKVSVTNIGIAISITLLLLFHLKRVADDQKAKGLSSDKELNLFSNVCTLAIIVVFMGSAIVACVLNIQKIGRDKFENECKNTYLLVSSDVEKTFQSIQTASLMISVDSKVKEALTNDNADLRERILKDYLKTVNDRLFFNTVFVVDEDDKAYYTSEGFLKYLNPDSDPYDEWYSRLINSTKDFRINITNDEHYTGAFSIYADSKIRDEKGNVIGVGGASINLTALQEKLRYYESEYKINIYFVNSDGLIQIATDTAKIKRDRLFNLNLSTLQAGDDLFEDNNGNIRISSYFEDYNGYLVIDFSNTDSFSVLPIIIPCLSIFLAGLLVMGLAFALLGRQETRSKERLMERTRISLTDELTGLHNRRAYEEELVKISVGGNKDEYIIVMLDVNGLKTVNDNIGHEAGDELLVSSAICMRECFGKYGKIFRTGGDEFVALLKCSSDDIEEAVVRFKNDTEEWNGKYIHGFTVSLGIVPCQNYPDSTIRELQILADKLMYEDKKTYYNRKNINKLEVYHDKMD